MNDGMAAGTNRLQTGGSGTDSDAIHVNESGEINGINEKTSLVPADLGVFEDSESGNAKKKAQLINYYKGHSHAQANTIEIEPGLPEIAGKRYTTLANAITYIGVSEVPASDNKFSFLVTGNNSESVELPSYCSIRGNVGSTRLTGQITTSGEWADNFDVTEWIIESCIVDDIAIGSGNSLMLISCICEGISPTAGDLALMNCTLVETTDLSDLDNLLMYNSQGYFITTTLTLPAGAELESTVIRGISNTVILNNGNITNTVIAATTITVGGTGTYKWNNATMLEGTVTVGASQTINMGDGYYDAIILNGGALSTTGVKCNNFTNTSGTWTNKGILYDKQDSWIINDAVNTQEAIDELNLAILNHGEIHGLTIDSTDGTNLVIESGWATDDTCRHVIESLDELTINLTDDLDTGSSAIDTWYYVHLFEKTTTGDVVAKFSLVEHDPTLGDYHIYRCIGLIKTDGSGDIIPMRSIGEGPDKFYQYYIRQSIATTPSGSYAALDCSDFAPPGCRLLEVGADSTDGGDDTLYLRETGTPGGAGDHLIELSMNAGTGGLTSRAPCNENQSVDWYGTPGDFTLYMLGFHWASKAAKYVGEYWETTDFDGSQQIDFDTTGSGADISGNVTSFPVCVRITDSAIIDAVRDEAPDIRFLDKDGTTWLDYEIEKWDKDNDEAVVWVLIPQVDGNADDDYITLYYGSDWVQDGQDSAAVFSLANGFLGVWHMNQDPTTDIIDSSENVNDGTGYNLIAGDLVDGPINKAIEFDEVGDEYIDIAGFDETVTDATLSAWVYVDTEEDAVKGVLFSRGTDNCGLHLSDDSGDNRVCYHWDGDAGAYGWQGGGIVDAQEWNFVAMTIDADADDTGYVGKNDGDWDSATNSITTGSVDIDDLSIGRDSVSAARYFDGKLAEIRFESVERSEDWLKLCYMNQKATDALISFP